MTRKCFHEQKRNIRDIFEKSLGMINDIENDQIYYFSVEAKKYIFRKIDVSTMKDYEQFSWSSIHNTSPPNMQFSSQNVKLKLDGKLTWVPPIVTHGHESVSDAKGAHKCYYRVRVWN